MNDLSVKIMGRQGLKYFSSHLVLTKIQPEHHHRMQIF